MATFRDVTTLRVGGPIGRLVEASSPAELQRAVRAADRAGAPLILLGGGSNVVASDAGAPLVVRAVPPAGRSGVDVVSDAGGMVVEVEAGVALWSLVEAAVEAGWPGFEALAGIPGSVGGAVVQNAGAYGREVGELIESVRVWDRAAGRESVVPVGELGLGYRTSRLKRRMRAAGAVAPVEVVLSVRFRVSAGPVSGVAAGGGSGRLAVVGGAGAVTGAGGAVSPDEAGSAGPRPGGRGLSWPVRYGQLAAALGVAVGDRAPLREVADAVVALRRGKGMVVDVADHDTWSAGSFFTNPVVAAERAVGLPPRAPRYAADRGPDGEPGKWVKTSAAWLIENAGVPRGWGLGASPRATTSRKHVLALTNRGEATASDIRALAAEIQRRVEAAYAIPLTPEPIYL